MWVMARGVTASVVNTVKISRDRDRRKRSFEDYIASHHISSFNKRLLFSGLQR